MIRNWKSCLLALVLPLLICSSSLGQELGQKPDQNEGKGQRQRGKMIVVVGAGGTDEYTKTFAEWADNWKLAAEKSDYELVELGRGERENDRELLKEILDKSQAECNVPLWLVMLGHGTSDRNVTKFNLNGPDVSGAELKEWLAGFRRPLILVAGFSCSGGMLTDLSDEDRVVITATNNGSELNYSRFGGFLAEATGDMSADLDHDDQVSLLEAYLLASSKVTRFYESDSRLATEHSLLEDNQDGKGTPSDFFVGIRTKGLAKDGSLPDGRLAHRYILLPSTTAPKLTAEQTAQRDKIESEIEVLRGRKSTLTSDEYYDQLEKLMLEMAELYDAT